jgi:hypothetical protein
MKLIINFNGFIYKLNFKNYLKKEKKLKSKNNKF